MSFVSAFKRKRCEEKMQFKEERQTKSVSHTWKQPKRERVERT